MIPGWISVIWRYRGENMMSEPGRGRCRSFCCGDGANDFKKKPGLGRVFLCAGSLFLVKLVTDTELCLPAAAEAGARSEALGKRNQVVRILIGEGDERGLTIRGYPFEFQEVVDVVGFVNTPVLADEVAHIEHVHRQGQGVFAPVFLFTGIEIDVFAYVQVQTFEERLNNGVSPCILTTVFVEIVVLGDEVVQLCPDLCGGAGVSGCTGRSARVCTGAVRSCVDEVDIAGALRDIDQVV